MLSGGATSGDSGQYRYRLWRTWSKTRPAVAFIMLNPSTADAETDDATIRRCLGFARTWDAGGIEVVNLFAWRSSRPRDLRRAIDPVGSDNDTAIRDAVRRCPIVVAAWGNHGALSDRDRLVVKMLGPLRLVCLGLTRQRHPRHPLYVPGDRARIPFDPGVIVQRSNDLAALATRNSPRRPRRFCAPADARPVAPSREVS
jgi:hypothetical protein